MDGGASDGQAQYQIWIVVSIARRWVPGPGGGMAGLRFTRRQAREARARLRGDLVIT